MKNKHIKIIQCIVIFVVSLFLVNYKASTTYAPGTVYEIASSSDLAGASVLSKTEGYQDVTFVLVNDITITDEEQNYLEENNQLINFGSSDFPFSGTFDGQGHTINNLNYSSTLSPKYDTGLFAYTNGATIKNLTINNANIYSDYRGGIVVGSAANTLIENVNVTNSHLFVSAINNVITLVTDGGIRGGAIVGEATDSVIYNCEVSNTLVNTNNTSAVAALGGKGLTLGAIAGKTTNSTIEYSRVTSSSKVSNYYDVAVGAVGGNTLYVGGIVGQMNGTSKVIDSFSTAELYYYCATYVSVGAGNVGHIGGITAAMNGNTNEIHRSHYAGIATSKQYNAVLVVPIIQNNVNISGIADIYDGGAVVSTYFKPSLNSNVSMNVLGNNSSTSSYGPLDDNKYTDKEYWQDQSYDFTGSIRRNTEYNNNHHNKWVIDTASGIPVHGKSISATFNFPNAGNVTIASSSLVNSNVTTNNPYRFAVQGYKPNESSASVSASTNSNYSFAGWYKVSDVYATSLDNDNDFFENIFDNNNVVSSNSTYSSIQFNDNDLYIARMKAKVIFHDVNGNTINEAGNQQLNYKRYYDYLEELPDVIPNTVTSATFIGWTTIPNTFNTGYNGITTTVLNNIKNQNEFYVEGDKVTKPLNLYPIYVDLLSNINVIFEGNEQDSIDDVAMRDGVGEAHIQKNNDDTISLSITGANSGNLPDEYRFLGWYDENGYRLSKDINYTFSYDDIDLTLAHTYMARFEYRVNYYIKAYHQDQNAFNEEKLFATKWMRYEEEFDNIGTPGYVREYITHWGISHVDHEETDNPNDAYSGQIVGPLNVYSHNYTSATGGSAGYRILATLDFPGSGKVTAEQRTGGSLFRFTSADEERYHLQFWTFQRSSNNESKTYRGNPMDTQGFETFLGLPAAISSASTYRAQAFVNTDIVFYKKDNTTTSVTRRFKSNVLIDEDTESTYYYPFYITDTVVNTETYNNETISSTVTLEASPSNASMDVNDYYFVGWISSTDVTVGSSEWNYIYDVSGDPYTSSNIKKVLPYIIDNNMQVEETMDLYPVYVKYNIETTTSLASITSTEVNKPSNPTYTLIKANDGTGTVTIVPDESTVIKNGESATYELDYLSLYIDDGDEIIINKDTNGEYKYNVTAGSHYKFVAVYIPYILAYHLNTNSIETKILNKDDPVGDQPTPSFTIANDYLFVGWSKNEPSGDYHVFENYNDYENANISLITPFTLVTTSYELYPIYVKNNITINSNIDAYLTAEEIAYDSVYALKRNYVDTMTLSVKIPKINRYAFSGWYENYVDNNNLGDLVSKDINYKLSTNDNFTNKIYTAVYKEIYEVKYHTPTGEVFATIYVHEDSNRKFVKTVLDSNNDPIEVPTDDSVYTTIYNYLDKNEYIKQFNYIKEDNTIIEWNDYKNNVITGDMDLYPVIYRITAKDSSNNNIDLTINNPRLNTALAKNNFLVKFNENYNEPQLTIHIDEIQYTRNTPITTNVNNKTVNLYKDNNDSNVLFTKNTDSSGNAIFDLKNKFTLNKINNGNKNSNDLFIFYITNTTTNITRKVVVPSNDSIIIELPYGSYTITEDNNWAWRYENKSSNITINNTSDNTLTITNQVINYNWFDNMTGTNNSYGDVS